MCVGCLGGVFNHLIEVIDCSDGFVVFKVSGEAALLFSDEAGGHRFQRKSPTEKRGRIHTSTITVATLAEPTSTQVKILDKDLEFSTTRSSGAGGQNVNKVESCVIVKHLPSGLMVRCETQRSQHQNKASALALLQARLWEQEQTKHLNQRANVRKQQIGSGQSGEKRRTIRCQDDQVNDHITGKHWSWKEYEKGNW